MFLTICPHAFLECFYLVTFERWARAIGIRMVQQMHEEGNYAISLMCGLECMC